MGGNPRNFKELDLYSLPSPCFVIDKKALEFNLKILQELKSIEAIQINLSILCTSIEHYIAEHVHHCQTC